MRIGVSLGILATVLLAGCGNYHEVYNPGNSSLDKSAFKTLSYAAVKTLVFDPYCFQCHGTLITKANLDVDKYQLVFNLKDKIKSDVMTNDMPDNKAPVPGDLKNILFAWIDAGAPVTSTIPMPSNKGAPPPPPPPPPGFDQVESKVFDPYCSRCHSIMLDEAQVKSHIADIQSAISSGKMPKNSKPLPAPLKEMVADWVKAGMPAGFDDIKHKLFEPYCIRCHRRFSGYEFVAGRVDKIQNKIETDKMPKGGPPLPDALKQLLSDWIKAGLPN